MGLLYFSNRSVRLHLDPLDCNGVFVEEFSHVASVVANVLPALKLELLFEIYKDRANVVSVWIRAFELSFLHSRLVVEAIVSSFSKLRLASRDLFVSDANCDLVFFAFFGQSNC